MAGNAIGDKYLASMLKVFGKDSALEELNLFGNRIGDQGVRLIIRKLRKLRKLKYLWLGQNPFGFMACSQLVEAMKCNNHTIEELSIRSMDRAKFKDDIYICLK